MSEPFIAEVRIFAGNFAPRGWAFCDGQLLPVSQNTALFSLLGTVFGGDGRTTVGLPDMQGRAPMHTGRGPGLTSRRLGQKIGAETATLSVNQIPRHTHTLRSSNEDAEEEGEKNPANGATARMQSNQAIYGPASSLQAMASESIASRGGGDAHNNMQPYLALNYIIALVGLYPSRS